MHTNLMVATETLTTSVASRTADWADFAVNSFGALIGLAVAILVHRTLAAVARTSPSSSL